MSQEEYLDLEVHPSSSSLVARRPLTPFEGQGKVKRPVSTRVSDVAFAADGDRSPEKTIVVCAVTAQPTNRPILHHSVHRAAFDPRLIWPPSRNELHAPPLDLETSNLRLVRLLPRLDIPFLLIASSSFQPRAAILSIYFYTDNWGRPLSCRKCD